MPKKIVHGFALPLLIVIIVAIIGLLLIAFFVFFRPKPSDQESTQPEVSASVPSSKPVAKQSEKPGGSTKPSPEPIASPMLSQTAFSSTATKFSVHPPVQSEVDEEPTNTGSQITITPPIDNNSVPYRLTIQISKTTTDKLNTVNPILIDKGYQVTETTVAEQPAKRYAMVQKLNQDAVHSIITIFYANNKRYYMELLYTTQGSSALNERYEKIYADVLESITL